VGWYKTGPCFETRTGTKHGLEPEVDFLQIMLLGKKEALNQLETFSLNYDIKDIFNQLHYEMYWHLITLIYIYVIHMWNWFHKKLQDQITLIRKFTLKFLI
jgi:hypothetical protein